MQRTDSKLLMISSADKDFQTNLSVGEILRRARLSYNISFQEASQSTRIRIEHLEALESNALDRLPGRVYVFGFVRTYSEYLGLDGDKMVKLLKKQAGRKAEIAKPVLAMPQEEEEEKTPAWPVVGFSALALLLTLSAVGFLTSAEAPMQIPPVPKELSDRMKAPQRPVAEKVASAPSTSQPISSAGPVPLSEQPAKPHPLVLKALANTWLEIRGSDHTVIFSRVLNRGEEYWVPEDRTDLSMTLGNAGGLQILVDGRPMPRLGETGQVRRNVSLNPSVYKEKIQKNGGAR